MVVKTKSSGDFSWLSINNLLRKSKELLSFGKTVLDNVVVKVTMVFYKSLNYYAE
jgi:hypothetical protein